jgi:hypothetical protein
MRSTGIAELSPRVLQSALYNTTEALAAELASPTAVIPAWTDVEWLMARAVVTIHGVAPVLRWRLRWEGAPGGWTQFLDEESAREQARYWRIHDLLQHADDLLRRAEVPAIGLKGTALYAAGLYRPGERPMADIDILVRGGSDFERAAGAFERLGFQPSSRSWKNSVFSTRDPGGRWSPRRPGEDPIKIELHERISEKLPVRIADISTFVHGANASPGLNSYSSRASLIAHLLLHASGSIVERALRLVQLHDMALLAGFATDSDWADALRIGAPRQAPWWAFPPLALIARYYPGRIPAWVLDAAHSACPPILRRIAARQRLSNASLSFPWSEAFPGIAWTRSPAEALAYVGRRIMRGREAATLCQAASQTEPGLSPRERSWLAEPQAGRILRWLLSRPARPLTMRVVRSSFGIPA